MKKQRLRLAIIVGFLSPVSLQSMAQRQAVAGAQAIKSSARAIPKQPSQLYSTQGPKKGLIPTVSQKMNLKPGTIKKLEAAKEKAQKAKTQFKELNTQRRPGLTSDADNKLDKRLSMLKDKISLWLGKDPQSQLQPNNPYAILDVNPNDSFEIMYENYIELMQSLQHANPQYFSRIQRLNLREADAQNIRTTIQNAYNMIIKIKELEDSIARRRQNSKSTTPQPEQPSQPAQQNWYERLKLFFARLFS